jgi:hypothetical protein
MSTDPVPMPASGPRVLGFGRDPATAAAIQDKARAAGFRATTFALIDDAEGDARLMRELEADEYDVVTFGGALNGQNPASPPDEHSTLWFERVLNIVHRGAPTARLALVRTADEYVSVVERVLGGRD